MILDLVIAGGLVVVGLAIAGGEMIAAMLSRDSVMEGKDDLQPVGVAPPVLIVAADPTYVIRVPPYVVDRDDDKTGPIPLDATEPIIMPSTWRSRGRDRAPEQIAGRES